MASEGVNVVFGGWYQRTTLHLSEIQRFLLGEKNNIELPEAKLKRFRDGLGLKSVKRRAGYLEYLDIETVGGLGLSILRMGFIFCLSVEMMLLV